MLPSLRSRSRSRSRSRRRRFARIRAVGLRLCIGLSVVCLMPLGIWSALGGVESFSPGQQLLVDGYLVTTGSAALVSGAVAIVAARRARVSRPTR